jgi:hypothetical protein
VLVSVSRRGRRVDAHAAHRIDNRDRCQRRGPVAAQPVGVATADSEDRAFAAAAIMGAAVQ